MPVRGLALAALAIGLVGWGGGTGCATSPYIEPFQPRVARPGPGEIVLVSDVLLVFDASGSIERRTTFPEQKAFFESFVSGMPPGRYRAGISVLGGRERDQLAPTQFARFQLRKHANGLRWSGRETPLAALLESQADQVGDHAGRYAFLIFSDGVPTRYGKYIGPEETLAAARALVARHTGEVCFHTLQIGTDPRGPALLQTLAEMSPCGSFHNLRDVDDRDALYAFQQQIFNGPAPPPKPPEPRAITDLDEDGVDDRFDRCARTPIGAVVDERGCWVIKDYVFELDRAVIVPEHRAPLDAVVAVLQRNATLRIRIDGHTDDTGAAAYNFDLAERRARAVSQYLQEHGIASERLELRSFGDSRPIASNASEAGRRRNRRVELSVIDR